MLSSATVQGCCLRSQRILVADTDLSDGDLSWLPMSLVGPDRQIWSMYGIRDDQLKRIVVLAAVV